MAEVQEPETEEVDSEPLPMLPEAKPSRSRKKLALVGAGVAIALLGAGGGAYVLMAGKEGEGARAPVGAGPESFVEIPPLTVNLRSADGTPRFLRVHLMLVPTSAGRQEEITSKLPLIIDAYQPFLRELRPEDLAGSAAAFRLKEEMLIRANSEVGEGAVADVLIQDLVQQ